MNRRMAVLVTRPTEQARSLVERLTAEGFSAVAFPLLDIAALDPGVHGLELLQDLDRFDLVIFVSRNAVKYGLRAIRLHGSALPGRLTCIAVGAATANELQAEGIAARLPAHHASEGVLMLPELRDVANRRILIVRGRGGRELLREQLQARGAQVEYLEVYQRNGGSRSPEELRRAMDSHELVIALITSGAALAELDSLLADPEHRSRFRVIVPSQRVGEIAAGLGLAVARVADGASDDEMIRALYAALEA